MAEDSFHRFRLAFMQDVLPVGLAMIQRVRTGGPREVFEVFTSKDDPIENLREEGEKNASSIRDQLDDISPGLGNPVVPVKVKVAHAETSSEQLLEHQTLLEALSRIENNIDDLKMHIDNDQLLNL